MAKHADIVFRHLGILAFIFKSPHVAGSCRTCRLNKLLGKKHAVSTNYLARKEPHRASWQLVFKVRTIQAQWPPAMQRKRRQHCSNDLINFVLDDLMFYDEDIDNNVWYCLSREKLYQETLGIWSLQLINFFFCPPGWFTSNSPLRTVVRWLDGCQLYAVSFWSDKEHSGLGMASFHRGNTRCWSGMWKTMAGEVHWNTPTSMPSTGKMDGSR